MTSTPIKTVRNQDESSHVIKVKLSDSSSKTIQLEENATASELADLIADKIDLPPSSRDFFSLWAQGNDGLELELHADMYPADVIVAWPELEERYMGRSNEDREISIVFKRRSLLSREAENLIQDYQAIHLLFIERVSDIVCSRYSCDYDTACYLAALQVQINYGDYKPAVHQQGFLTSKLSTIFPSHLLRQKGGGQKAMDKIERAILEKMKTLPTRRNCLLLKMTYMATAQDVCTWYGGDFFMAQLVQEKKDPLVVFLAITTEALFVIDRSKLEAVVTVRRDESSLSFTTAGAHDFYIESFVFSFANKKKTKFKEYTLLTRQNEMIKNILENVITVFVNPRTHDPGDPEWDLHLENQKLLVAASNDTAGAIDNLLADLVPGDEPDSPSGPPPNFRPGRRNSQALVTAFSSSKTRVVLAGVEESAGSGSGVQTDLIDC